MAYSKEVLEHYDNPRNVGSLDKKDPNVGTGLVGAPECFSGETLIALPDKEQITLKEMFENGEIIPVVSYNVENNYYEAKNAKAISSGKKLLHRVRIGETMIWVTPDHEFLTSTNEYVENSKINSSIEIKSKLNFEILEETKEEMSYTLQVEENNNYCLLVNTSEKSQLYQIVRNCGDVMKLQIKVDENEKIVDAKFKTFGCLGGQTRIYTPEGYTQVRKLRVNDEVVAWNGKRIGMNKIQHIYKHNYELTDLIRFQFEHADRKVTVSKDHIFWTMNGKPIEADDVKFKDKIMGIDNSRVKVVSKEAVINESQVRKLERTEEGYVVMYDIKLYDGMNMYFTTSIKALNHNCGSAIASSSLATEWVMGKTVDEAAQIKNTEVVEILELPPVKIHCSVLAEDAIKAAIADYKSKKVAIENQPE